MKILSKILIGYVLLYASPIWAQFNVHTKLGITDTLTIRDIDWVDLNNDTWLDVLVKSETSTNEVLFLIYKNVEGNDLEYVSKIKTGMKELSHYITDVNLDNQLDIVVSGMLNGEHITTAFVHSTDLEFEYEILHDPLLFRSGSFLALADLNNDGYNELILSGKEDTKSFLTIYEKGETDWTIYYDSVGIQANEIIIHDFNRDLYKDLVVQGKTSDDIDYAVLFYNKGNLNLIPPSPIAIEAGTTITSSDFNYDGIFDLFISKSLTEQQFYLSGSSNMLKATDTLLINYLPDHLSSADYNSDGLIDISFQRGQETILWYADGNLDTLYRTAMISQKFGDFDKDGDLDLIQGTTDSLFVLTHEVPKVNTEPALVNHITSMMIYDHLFLYWPKTSDDHTPEKSVTYDLSIQSEEGDIMMGQYDLLTNRRLSVTSGNNESFNFNLIDNPPGTNFNLYVQSIDNSFHAGGHYQGWCDGSAPCQLQSTLIEIPTCGEEKIILKEKEPTQNPILWFSFANGFLGESETYTINAAVSDTIFSFNPYAVHTGCGQLTIYQLKRYEHLYKKDSTLLVLCPDTTLMLSVEENWPSIVWKSSDGDILSKANEISYPVDGIGKREIISVVSNGAGCTIERKTKINISKPNVTVVAEQNQIMQGDNVQLVASGANQYRWSPASELNDPDSNMPIASPTQTTQYTVTGYDTLGCIDRASVIIKVESSAFIPNLFTPNQDGANDNLKIYGINQAASFSFAIYNREGTLVYNTENVQEVVSNGWNGSYNGVYQPNGVYQWKVSGKYPNGKKILINGKQSGSVVLLR